MTAPAIAVQGVSKRFRAPGQAPRTLKEWLLARFRPRPAVPEFWALRDVALTVQAGEAIGLVGDNGSGKSTLLKLIVGILAPTHGTVAVAGRISALLELGAGFHPEFTGRENVYLNAAILGLSRAETEARFAEIVAFADIGDFLDAPVKTYSSGMYMRLAFAIATHVDPDVLLIDEVLAVGDAAFQRKCLDRLRTFRKAGKTIVLVTHDPGAVADLCDRAVWLVRGRIEADGPVHAVLDRYGRGLAAQAAAGQGLGLGAPAITGRPGPAPGVWDAAGPYEVAFDLDAPGGSQDLQLQLKVFKAGGICCYTGRTPVADLGGEAGRVVVAIPEMPLLSGAYTLEVVLASGPVVLAARQAGFDVHSPVPGDGVAPLHCHWSLAAPPAPAHGILEAP